MTTHAKRRLLRLAVLHHVCEERGRDVEAESILYRLERELGTGNETVRALDQAIADLRELVMEDL